MKQLQADRGKAWSRNIRSNGKFTGRVTNITDYGAFVELRRRGRPSSMSAK